MISIFLLSLYLSFISMGLYSSMFGQVWPVAQLDFGVSGSYGALVNVGLTGGTIIGSLIGAWVQKKIGAGKTTFLAVLLLGIICFGLSIAPSFLMFILLFVPLGMMGGMIDVTINNYVAQNFKPQFMSWLHGVWGVGSFLAPNIAAYFLKRGEWRGGYRSISMIQIGVSCLMLFMIPQWDKHRQQVAEEETEAPRGSPVEESVFQIEGIIPLLIAVFFYGGAENTLNYWGSTYLVNYHLIAPDTAAQWMSLFFAGIMISRIASGFAAMKFNYKTIVNASQFIMIFGGFLLLMPFGNTALVIGIFLFGFGCGPVAPGKLHLAPKRFGRHRAQKIIGLQTAFLFTGGMILPPLVGIIGSSISFLFLPIMLVFFSVVLMVTTRRVNRLTSLI